MVLPMPNPLLPLTPLKSGEVYEKLNCKRKIWAERSVVLDEVDPAIRANLRSRG